MAENKTQIIITAKDETRAALQSVQAGLSSLEKTAVGLGPIFAGLGAALSFGALTAGITNTLKFAASLDDMAEKTGASVENLSALASVAKVGGHDIGLVDSALQKLAKSLHGTGEESKGAAAALEALGLSADELRQMDTAEAMLKIAKALDQFRDGSGKSAAAMALLGKSGAEALPFLKDLAEQSELVGKVTTEQAAQAEAYEKNLNRLAASFGAAGKAAAYELLPFLEKLTSEMVRAKDESGSFASVFGEGVRTALEAVAVLGVNVIYVFKQIGNEIGGIAAQAVALARLDFKGFGAIGDAMKEDAKVARAEVDRLSADLLDRSKKTKEAIAEKPALSFKPPEAKLPKARTGGGRSQIDEAERLIASLNEQIALKQIDADSTEKMTASEQQAARVRYQLEAGTLKATEAQRAAINARLDDLVSMDKALTKQREFADGVRKLEESTVRQRQEMIAATQAAEEQAAAYGMSSAQLSTMTQARLEDAIATARQNGAGEEQIKVLEEELALRERYTAALEKSDLARDLAATKSAKEAQETARKARYDVALAKGDITEKQYKELVDNLKQDVDEMGEFMKQAARNMQDAFAELFINPTGDGIRSWGETFAKTLQKMIAQAGSAQLLKLMLGDVDKTGSLGGWIGELIKPLKGLSWDGLFSGSSTSAFVPYTWANGGIMTSAGPLPLNTYAGGGVANRPQLALFGEGRTPEAYVPLPDGKRIPVAMQGGTGANITVNVNSQTGDPAEIRRSAAAGARTALGLMSGAGRYR